jgi:hypothetical protein
MAMELDAARHASRIAIHLAADATALERRAADQLHQYIVRLFRATPSFASTMPDRGSVFCLGTSTSGRFPDTGALDEQAFVVRSRREGDLAVCECVGGSPAAVQWAVYAVIEQWGVHYLFHRDVMPDDPGPFRLPDRPIGGNPLLRTRSYRLLNDMINSSEFWSLAEHEALLDQLVKLRFTHVYLATYPFHPWVHWSYRGVSRREVTIGYGFRHDIRADSVGCQRLGIGEYTNADLRGDSYEARIEAGRRFMHALIDAAQRRGLKVMFNQILTQLPEEIKRHLGHWSGATDLPPPSSPPVTHPHSLGVQRDGGESRFGHLMTPLNPVYVDMVESWLAAHLREYGEIDGVLLSQQEFPANAAGVERCWRDLDDRHGISKHISLEALLERGEALDFHTPGRGLLQTKGAIVMLRLLDLVINEHRIIDRHLSPDATIYVRFMNHLVMPLAPYVFDADRVQFVAAVDYTASDVARRIDSLAFARDTPMKIHLVVSPEDDNRGFIPQMTGEALERVMQGVRAYGLCGYFFRHWLVSKLEPAMGFLVDAAWDAGATAASSVTRQVSRICGDAAVEPVVAAYRMLAEALDETDKLVGIGFLMPTLMRRRWETPLGEQVPIVDRLIDVYEQVVTKLRAGLDRSAPRGRSYLQNMIAYVAFGRRYLLVIKDVDRARRCYDRARDERAKGAAADIDVVDEGLREASARLDAAVGRLRDAMQLWDEHAVADPSDRGTLAGLNVYALDYLRAKATEVRLIAEQPGPIPL